MLGVIYLNKSKLPVELHIHTQDSRFDSVVSVKDLADKLSDFGCKKVAITEHGVLTSIDSANMVLQEKGIELVPALEAYVRLQETTILHDQYQNIDGRGHMCIFAKDKLGYQAIKEACTDSFECMERKIPVMNQEILEKYFGEHGYGHDHVIASSACISGVLSNILLWNNIIDKNIKKLNKKILKRTNGITPELPNVEEEKILEDKITKLEENIQTLTPLANKKFKAKENAINKWKDDPNYEDLKLALETEKKESEEAAIKLSALKKEKKKAKMAKTVLHNNNKKQEELYSKVADLQYKIKCYKNAQKNKNQLYNLAKERALFFSKLFGSNNFYIELQYHGMPEEKEVFPILLQIAKECNLPILITNDAHMLDNSDDSRRARQLIRSMRYIDQSKKENKNIWQKEGVADKELYIKSEDELAHMLQQIIPEKDVKIGISNRQKLINCCHVDLSPSENYPKYPEEIPGENSIMCLKRKIAAGRQKRFPFGYPNETYAEREKHETETICRMGFADYHLIVQDYTHYIKILGKFDFNNLPEGFFDHIFDLSWLEEKSKNLLGVGVGPGRGSAAGSLVCYLLGITDVDPIPYNLIFERFLNPARVSMPDIDVDFAIHLKQYAYNYVAYKYGSENVCHIMTRGTQQGRKSIDNCSKLLGSKLHGSTTYFSQIADKIKSLIDSDGNLPSDAAVLNLFNTDTEKEISLQILKDAKLVLNTCVSDGMHAAGVVISNDIPVKKHVALMKDKTGEWKTQCNMMQVEECHGLLKMDFLGLENLNIITDTIQLIFKRYGISIYPEKIPFEADVFENIYAKGFTNGVFQVESPGMKKMLAQANPKSIEDIIILISMYRPGPMDFLPKLIEVMSGKKRAEYLIPELEPILSPTYGCIVYQEQVMQIFQKLAGYSLGDADLVRRAMSKKKMEKILHEKEAFLYGDKERNIIGCKENNIPLDAAETLFEQMTEFAKYAFNKSHATVYAYISYWTAWLKYHYPKEYICSIFNHVTVDQNDKKNGFLNDCKALGIPFELPDINESEEDFAINNDAIYFGLSHILNVASRANQILAERKLNGKYISLADFIVRTNIKGNSLKNLILSGACDSLSASRQSMLKMVEEESFQKIITKIHDKKKLLQDDTLTEKRKNNAEAALNQAIMALKNYPINYDIKDNVKNRLLEEKRCLGIMVSGHIMDAYGTAEELHTNNIATLSDPKESVIVAGMVAGLKLLPDRKMAFFTLESKDGSVPVCVFPRTYEKFEQLLCENAVLSIMGTTTEREKEYNGKSEIILEVIASSITVLSEKKEDMVVFNFWHNKKEKEEFLTHLKPYIVKHGGCSLIAYNVDQNKFIKTNLFVDRSLLQDKFFIVKSY